MSSNDAPAVKGHEILQGVATKALDDDDYRRQLLDDPKGVLRDAGLTVDDCVNVVVHEDTGDEIHLVLPAQPPSELSPGEIDLQNLNVAIHF